MSAPVPSQTVPIQAEPAVPPTDDLALLERDLIRVARRVLTRPVPRATHQVEKAGYMTLATLEACGEARLSDLAGRLELDTSTVSRQVRILTAIGMVERLPDPLDRRASRLVLTGEGRRALQLLREARHAVLDAAMTTWSADDRDRLVSLLGRLAADLDSTRHPEDATAVPQPPSPALAPATNTANREVTAP